MAVAAAQVIKMVSTAGQALRGLALELCRRQSLTARLGVWVTTMQHDFSGWALRVSLTAWLVLAGDTTVYLLILSSGGIKGAPVWDRRRC